MTGVLGNLRVSSSMNFSNKIRDTQTSSKVVLAYRMGLRDYTKV
jgi:hypothetical protein